MELIERGAAARRCSCILGIGIVADSRGARTAGRARPRAAAAATWSSGRSEQERKVVDPVDELRLLLTLIHWTSSTCATRRCCVRSGGWIAAATAIKSTARTPAPCRRRGRHQGRRPRDPRHRRHLRDPEQESSSSPISIRPSAPATTRRCRTATCWPRRATGKPPRARLVALHARSEAARPLHLIRVRPCCCGEPPTASCPSPMAAPMLRRFRGRGSSRSSALATFRISSSRRRSPQGFRLRRRENRDERGGGGRVYQFTEQPYPTLKDHQGSCASTCRTANRPGRRGRPVPPLLRRMADRHGSATTSCSTSTRTATCMSSTVVVGLSVLARQTRRARLLCSAIRPATGRIRCGWPRSLPPSTLSCAAARHGLHQGRAYGSLLQPERSA